MTKTIPLYELLQTVRPLPWPVNGKIEERGALSPDQLEATRIYRRHAANQLPEVVRGLQAIVKDQFCCSNPTETRPRQIVTREMALDAGDLTLEGSLCGSAESEPCAGCPWCIAMQLLGIIENVKVEE